MPALDRNRSKASQVTSVSAFFDAVMEHFDEVADPVGANPGAAGLAVVVEGNFFE